jgi:diaminopimelate epimerase
MHGCGNDFVLIDADIVLTAELARAICDRRRGVGADGVIVIGPEARRRWPVVVQNADGSVADACGNGYRCVARYLLDRRGGDECELGTPAGPVRAARDGDAIALQLPVPTVGEAVALDGWGDGHRVRAGNPNVVVFVADVGSVDLPALAIAARAAVGPANVSAATVRSRSHLELRVHERGVGETLACGTGSCAAVAAGLTSGVITAGPVRVDVRGGALTVLPGVGRYTLTGPTEYVFEGELPL